MIRNRLRREPKRRRRCALPAHSITCSRTLTLNSHPGLSSSWNVEFHRLAGGAGSILQRDGGGGEVQGEAALFWQQRDECGSLGAGLAQFAFQLVQHFAQALVIKVFRHLGFIPPVVPILRMALLVL